MELKIGVADIVDKMSAQDIKDVFKDYLEKHAESLFIANDGIWSKKITPFGKEVISMLREDIEEKVLTDLMANVDFMKEIEKIKEEVKKELAGTIKEGLTRYVIEKMFVDKDNLITSVYKVLRDENCRKY